MLKKEHKLLITDESKSFSEQMDLEQLNIPLVLNIMLVDLQIGLKMMTN